MVSGIGLELGVVTVLGAFLGNYLDERWGTGPWLTLLGMFCGLGIGISSILRIIGRMDGG
jgi:F0F1-type ATP synthase assembly protein I